MFAERLQKVLSCIDATDVDIANYAGFDRTNISHLRSGRRTAKPSGTTTEKLIEGICLFAKDKGVSDQLCLLIGAEPGCDLESLKSALSSWLFEGIELVSKPAVIKEKKRRPKFHSFGEKLETAMNLAGVSNVRLSKLVHTDASLISRYRKGIRTPYSNPELLNRLCSVLYERILNARKIKELAEYCAIPAAEFDEEDFRNWLHDSKDHPEENIQLAESLLGSFDSYQAESTMRLPSLDEVIQTIDPDDKANTYWGQEGIRRAVLRFLANAVKENIPELRLYSDEDQSWLTGDMKFLLKWAALMSACVKNGTHIRIIHNVDRDLAEMHQAIVSWLPLYMSGMIESWYSKKGRDRRFSHTIFLSPGRECIEAFHAVGNESKGIYHYYTDTQSLETCRNAFNLLINNSARLIRPVLDTDINIDGEAYLIQNTLSVATMPENLVMEINDPVLTEKWRIAHQNLLDQLSNGVMNECIPLANDEDLFAGKVSIEPIDGTTVKYYTPEQYSLHIQGILDLLKNYANYHFIPLPGAPFPNMKLQLTNTESRITHIVPPQGTFSFEHPLMCSAFCDYARSLIEQNAIDRKALNDRLHTLL